MQPPNAAPSVPAGPTSAPTSFDPIAEMEDKRNRKEKGKLIISFNSDEDFERIIQILKK